jgi:hypothetical protein
MHEQAALLNVKEDEDMDEVTAEDLKHLKGVAFTAADAKPKGRATAGGRGRGRASSSKGRGSVSAGRSRGR